MIDTTKRIKETKIGILLKIGVVLFLVGENVFEVDCEAHFNDEKTLQNQENLTGLIFVEDNRINILNSNDGNLIELVTSSEPKSPVFSCKRKTLYWIDESWKIQARENAEPQTIFEDQSLGLKSLALDFVTDKLYIGNDVLKTIEVIDLKNGNRGIVRSEKLSSIKSIAIDPIEGYLFILGQTELIRMDLDGSNIHYIRILEGSPVLRHQNAQNFQEEYSNRKIISIALHLKEKRVYWVTAKHGEIFSSTYDGTEEIIIKKMRVTKPDKIIEHKIGNPPRTVRLPWYLMNEDKTRSGKFENPSRFVFLSDIPYWIYYDTKQAVIQRLNFSIGHDEPIYQGNEKIIDINSVNCNSADQPQATDPCGKENGGCQHLCILSRSSENKYRCLCNAGYELAKDGKSCISPTQFIAFSQGAFVRGIHWREDVKQYIDVLDPSKHIAGRGTHFDMDAGEGVFYLSNSGNHTLQSFNLDNRRKVILQSDSLATVACDVAYDWASKNLYYFNQYYVDGTLLRVLNLKNPTYSKILAKRKWFNSGLVVHPNKGYVYFLEGSTIRRIHADGSNSTLLYRNSKWITSFAIDYNEQKLFWIEEMGVGSAMYYSNLDGKKIKEVKTGYLNIPSMMMIQGDWIYIINNREQSLDRVPKKGGELEELVTSDYLCGLRSFDTSIQTTRSDHPCASSENICEKFCFAVPIIGKNQSLQRVCGCPYGEKLANDGRTCVDNSKEEPPLVPCPSEGYDCYNFLEDCPLKIKLVRMDLDGLNMHYILQAVSYTTYSLTTRLELEVKYIALDLQEKRLYWINYEDGTISSSTYDGTDRKFHLKLEPSRLDTGKHAEMPSRIAFLSNIPYWIDNNQGVIRTINLSNATDSRVITEAAAKKIFFFNSVNCNSTTQEQAPNPCDLDNGGCEHLCILSRSSESNYRCFCNVGYDLAKDGKSCISPTKFILFAQDGFVRGIKLREDEKQYIEVFDRFQPDEYFCPVFDVDTKENVFYQPTSFDELRRVDLHGGKHVNMLANWHTTVAAIDWVTKNLYFIHLAHDSVVGLKSSGQPLQYLYPEEDTFLRVLNTKNSTYSKVLAKGRFMYSGLAVHPNRGYVYYQETENNIRRVLTDGSNSTLILEKSKTIRCITIDYMEDKLYWVEIEIEADAKNFRQTVMYRSNLDGKNIVKIHENNFLHEPSVMAIQGDWIYIINNDEHSLDRVSKKGGELEQLITSRHTCGLRVFDPTIQTIRSDHPCVSDENPCDKFCFAVPLTETDEGLGRVCGCPYGGKLAEDGRSCVDNSKEEPPIGRPEDTDKIFFKLKLPEDLPENYPEN